MNFVIVEWLEKSGGISVAYTKDIVSRETVDPDNYAKLEPDLRPGIQLHWPLIEDPLTGKKKKNEKHGKLMPAKILAFRESLEEVRNAYKQFQEAVNESQDPPMLLATVSTQVRARKRPARLIQSDSDDDEDMEEGEAKVVATDPKARSLTKKLESEKVRKQIEEQITIADQPDDAPEHTSSDLQSMDKDDLVRMIERLQRTPAAMPRRSPRSSPQKVESLMKTPERVINFAPRKLLPASPNPEELPRITHQPRPRSSPVQVAGLKVVKRAAVFCVDKDGMIDIGQGYKLRHEAVAAVPTTNKPKTIYAAAVAVFGLETLKTSSVSGKASNAHKDITPKPALCAKKMDALAEFVRSIWPGTDREEVRRRVGQKINIVTKPAKSKA